MKILVFFLGGLASVAFCAILGIAYLVWDVDRTWSPVIEPRIAEQSTLGSIRVLAADPKQPEKHRWIGSFTAGRMEEREALKLADIPPLLIQSIVALEDPRFLNHEGFDVWGILRAFYKNLVQMRYAQGGSTITQQLVKNVFLSNEKTLKRKFTELILAALVERKFSKDEILEAYMNEVYLGQLGAVEIHGVGRAAEYYFNKKVGDLELAEMALIAAMVNGPGLYIPWRYPDRAKARRDKVLNALKDANLILPQEYETATKALLPARSEYAAGVRAPYLMDALKARLIDDLGELKVLQGGFDAALALDLDLQELAESTLAKAGASWAPGRQAAIVAADPTTCEIRVYAGGTDYRIAQLDHIRQIQRPIGSLMKPLAIQSLLQEDKNLSLASVLSDQPLDWSFDHGRSNWKPINYDKKFRGDVTLRQTLEESLNVPFVRVFFEREPSGLLGSMLEPVRELGLKIPKDRALPSSLLGALEQRPQDVLLAYVKLARRALGLAPNATDDECELDLLRREAALTESGQAYGQEGARLTLAALEGALRRGTSAALGKTLPPDQGWAGKTGTSSELRDSWYVSLSPRLVVLGWVGRSDNGTTGLTGATGALPLVMPVVQRQAGRNPDPWNWPIPASLKWRALRTDTHCAVREEFSDSLLSASSERATSTPPPPTFEHLGQSYVFELASTRTAMKSCLE